MRGPKRNPGLVAAVRAGAALTLAGAQGCTEPEAAEGISVQTAPVELRGMRITAEADGHLEPVLKVEVKSKASGEILELFVDSGDEVEVGTLLARVDPRDVENAWEQARADLDVADARMENARAQLERSRRLRQEEVITRQEFESRELEHANAQAALVRATTNLELARLRRTDVTIKAPMAGTILEKLVEYGQVIQSATQNVSGGTTLFVMANLDDMRVRTLVAEVDVGKLSAGLPATVRVDAFRDRTFQGHIEKIEPQAIVQQNVTMFPVIVLLDNRAGLLKPGMNAEVEVLVDERSETLAVPNNAIVQPQEMAAAAEVLGLDPESFSVDFSAWGPLMAQAGSRFEELAAGNDRFGGGQAVNGVRGDNGDQGDAAEPSGDAGGEAAGTNGMGNLADLRARIGSGEISEDSARALFSRMRQRRSGAGRQAGASGDGESVAASGAGGEVDGQAQEGDGGGRRAGRRGGAGGQGWGGGGPRGGRMAATGGSTGDRAYRPAVVFVVDEAGNMTPRPVVMGLSDWDYIEILAGLEAGEQLALIGAAQLQARQQERLERIRQRMRPF